MMSSYREYTLHPSLANHSKCLWILERDFEPLNGSVDVLPDSYIEVIFNFGSRCTINNQPLPACYAANLLDKPFRLSTTGLLKTIGIRFFAWGFSSLTGIELQMPFQPLDSNWQHLGAQLENADDATAVTIIHDHLMKCAASSKLQTDHNPAQMLFDRKGGITIAELAHHYHLSRRQLERKFRESVGISPKTLARRMRFEQVRDRLCGEPEVDFSSLALDYGFTDQSHLSREFKLFSNRTLGQFTAEIRSIHAPLRYGVAFP